MPPWLPRALFESALIVVSVLVALAVDEWSENRSRAERAELALAGIRAELEENRRAVEAVRARHLALVDSLTAYAEGTPPERIYMGGIFNPASPLSTAWESARETGALADIPYPLVLELSRVYDQQGRYRALAEALVQDIMGDVRREGPEAVLRDGAPQFIALDGDFANRESFLIERYVRALAAIDSIGG